MSTKQQTFVYYISGLGYGHLTRSMAVIKELVKQDNNVHILLRCAPYHIFLAQAYFSTSPQVSIIPFNSAFSVVLEPQNFAVNLERTAAQALLWIQQLEIAAEKDALWLKQHYPKISLIISDIAPEAFKVAELLKIRAVAISNFTWYEICTGLLPEAELEVMKQMYNSAYVMLEYPLSTDKLIPISQRIPIGLVSRTIDTNKVHEIRSKYKKANRPLVFFSIGGAMNLGQVQIPTGIDVLYTQGMQLAGKSNVYRIAESALDTQNYIAACDAVITKCGWSTIAEALIAKRPLFLLKSGGGWVEENCIWTTLMRLNVATEVSLGSIAGLSVHDFQAMINKLEHGYSQDNKTFNNDGYSIAKYLLQCAEILT